VSECPVDRSVPDPNRLHVAVRARPDRSRALRNEPYTLDPSAPVPTVVLTLTDRHSSLSGAFQDATGRATSDITVVVLPGNPAWWGETSRRVRVQRPGTNGKCSFFDLPPGDYVIVAVTCVNIAQRPRCIQIS